MELYGGAFQAAQGGIQFDLPFRGCMGCTDGGQTFFRVEAIQQVIYNSVRQLLGNQHDVHNCRSGCVGIGAVGGFWDLPFYIERILLGQVL